MNEIELQRLFDAQLAEDSDDEYAEYPCSICGRPVCGGHLCIECIEEATR